MKWSWNLTPILQIFQTILENYCRCLQHQLARSGSLWDVVPKLWDPRLRACVTFCYYPSLTHQKIFRFSDVFRRYRKTTPGCNGLRCLVGVKADMTWTIFSRHISFSLIIFAKNLKPVLFRNIKGQWNTRDGKYIICGFKF